MSYGYFRTPDDRKVYYHDIATAIATLHPRFINASVKSQIEALGLTSDFERGHTASPVPFANKIEPIWIYFTNWRGEPRTYLCRPLRTYFGINEYHKKWQLLMDVEAEGVGLRTIAVKDIHSTLVSGDPEIEAEWKKMVELHKKADYRGVLDICHDLNIAEPTYGA